MIMLSNTIYTLKAINVGIRKNFQYVFYDISIIDAMFIG